MFDIEERVDHAIPELTLNDDVPEEVVTRFGDVEQLLEQARENERMLRVAIEYTMTTTELALRLLCVQLGLENVMERDSNQTLPNLLEWLHKRDYLPYRAAEEPEDYPRSPDEDFDRDLPGSYRALHDLRNSWMHAKDASWLGWGFLKNIPRDARFVNRLYDAPRRRREERKKRREVNRHCGRLKEEGVVLDVDDGDSRHLLHEVNMLYHDAREGEEAFYFAMWPVFDRDFEEGVEVEEYAPFLAKCTTVCLEDRGQLALETRQGSPLVLDPYLTEEEEAQFNRWIGSDRSRERSIAFRFSGPSLLSHFLLGLESPRLPVFVDKLNWID